MEFSELVKKRQSDRKYADKNVEIEKLNTCLETARLSPSACNSQPWKFVVINEPDLKTNIANCIVSMGMNKFAHQTPVFVAVVLEKMNLTASIGSVIKDKEFSLLDIGIAVNQFCLQAAELGLGTCIIGWFDEKKVKQLLGVHKQKRIPVMIAVGYPDAPTREKTRKSIEQMSCWNHYTSS